MALPQQSSVSLFPSRKRCQDQTPAQAREVDPFNPAIRKQHTAPQLAFVDELAGQSWPGDT